MELARDGDTAAVLTEVERFAGRSLAPVAAGEPLAGPALARALAEARDLGLVPAVEDAPGLALWDDADDARGPARSVRVLTRLAHDHAGAALALHLEAVGAQVARALGAGPGRWTAAVHGRFGLARGALARHLAGAALDGEDRALLADVFGEGPRLVTAPDGAGALLAPRWIDDGLVWVAVDGAAIAPGPRPPTHGFDELTTFQVAAHGAALPHAGDGRALMIRALVLDGLGRLAIARGATGRAALVARTYAATRRQGGALIERHAAVQQLLASGRAALHTVDALLAAAAGAPVGAATLGPTLAARAEGHVLLCRAANDAVQVLGGLGYMREAGVEKALRDVNHLRVTGGSPPELALFLEAWERARD